MTVTGKTVPKPLFDRNFQSALLRTLVQHPDESREIITGLIPEAFDSAGHRWIMRKIQWCVKTGTPVTLRVLNHELKLDIERRLVPEQHKAAHEASVASLTKAVPDRDYLLNKAHDYIRFVSLREMVIDIADGLGNPETIQWNKVREKIDNFRQLGERHEGGLGQSFFEDAVARIRRRLVVDAVGIPTGTAVDIDLRYGGLPPGKLGLVIAPPGRGKSSWLVFVGGTAVLLGKKVLYVTMELNEDDIAEKFDTRFSGIEISGLVKKPRTLHGELQTAQSLGGDLKIKYFPANFLTIEGLRAYLQRLQAAAWYPDLVLIDYADLMDISDYAYGTQDKDYSMIGRLFVALRGLSAEMGFALWTASQANRLSLDKDKIGLADLAASFKKAEIVDLAIAIAQTEKELIRRLARLVVAKNRLGPTGGLHAVVFDTGRVRIGDA